jgi:hypothetical protein
LGSGRGGGDEDGLGMAGDDFLVLGWIGLGVSGGSFDEDLKDV